MNASSPAARVRRGGALALLTVAALALFTALLALTPATPDAAAAAAHGCDELVSASFAADDCSSDHCVRATAAATDCCDGYYELVVDAAAFDDCSDMEIEETTTPIPATTVPTTGPTTAPTALPAPPTPTAPTPASTTVPARPTLPPPPPIIGPITTGPITGYLSAQLIGQELTITVPADLAVQLNPAVYINAGGSFHAGPLPADGEVTLTVRPGTGPIYIALQGTAWTGARYTESLVVPR